MIDCSYRLHIQGYPGNHAGVQVRRLENGEWVLLSGTEDLEIHLDIDTSDKEMFSAVIEMHQYPEWFYTEMKRLTGG